MDENGELYRDHPARLDRPENGIRGASKIKLKKVKKRERLQRAI
jgi:hypothetical protein